MQGKEKDLLEIIIFLLQSRDEQPAAPSKMCTATPSTVWAYFESPILKTHNSTRCVDISLSKFRSFSHQKSVTAMNGSSVHLKESHNSQDTADADELKPPERPGLFAISMLPPPPKGNVVVCRHWNLLFVIYSPLLLNRCSRGRVLWVRLSELCLG